ncbi:MAG: hypothetical protein ACI4UH_03785 [Dorea sp.]
MNSKLPFYMAYQSPPFWSDERMNQRDYEYIKGAYPDTAKRLLPYIEEECDRMEYAGSLMYDEYPDQLQLRLMCRRIYGRVADGEKNAGKWLDELIQVMLYQEICQRRQEHRRYRKIY